jgi:small subunit ribosomal protein S4
MALFPPNKAFERRGYPPGVHGQRFRRKVTDYGLGLSEKQKLRYLYDVTERQFRRIFARAKGERGVTGEVFLRMLEMRLDSVVYLAGFTRTRRAARQMVNHRHVLVNGKRVDIAGHLCCPGDHVSLSQADHSKHLAMRNLDDTRYRSTPPWMQTDTTELVCTVHRVPTREEMVQGINEQVVVEFYSR